LLERFERDAPHKDVARSLRLPAFRGLVLIPGKNRPSAAIPEASQALPTRARSAV